MGIPGIVRYAKQGNLGNLLLVHRVRNQTGDVFHIRIQAIGRSHVRIASAAQVVYRIVPPDIHRTVGIFTEPVDHTLVNLRNDPVARPHNLYILRKRFVQHLQMILRAGRPVVFPVDLRAENQRPHIALRFNIILDSSCKCVQMREISGSIVEEQAELTNADAIQLVKFVKQRLEVFFRSQVNAPARMGCPDELYLGLTAQLDQFFDLRQFVIWIGISPLPIVIRIILRAVEIGVHFELPAVLHDALAVFMAPCAIKTFNEAAEFNACVVFNQQIADFAVRLIQNLAQRYQAIECGVACRTRDSDGLVCTIDGQYIAINLVNRIAGIVFSIQIGIVFTFVVMYAHEEIYLILGSHIGEGCIYAVPLQYGFRLGHRIRIQVILQDHIDAIQERQRIRTVIRVMHLRINLVAVFFTLFSRECCPHGTCYHGKRHGQAQYAAHDALE